MEIGFMNSCTKIILFAFLLYSCAGPVPKKNRKDSDMLSSVAYLNKIRKDLGMIALKKNERLSRSSLNHARYLTKFGYQEGHFENNKSNNLFTGYHLKDRVKFVGYNTAYSGENIAQASSFNTNYLEQPFSESSQVITELLAAIYHRFVFLNYTYDEIGFGKDSKNYVYNLGNSYIDNLCSKNHKQVSGKFYTDLCREKGKMIRSDYKEAAINKVIKKNGKDYIIFPGPGFKTFHPVFYEEMPDPLPDLGMSGNPISIHFGPHIKKKIKIIKFNLINLKNNKVIKIRELNSKNDPNKKFRENFFAFFPLKRLDWDTDYSASLTYEQCKKICKSKERKSIKWSFRTRKLKYNTLTLLSRNPKPIQIRNGEKTILYFKPEMINEKSSRFYFNFKYPVNKKPLVKFELLDSNTGFIEIKKASPGQVINLFYEVERQRRHLVIKVKT